MDVEFGQTVICCVDLDYKDKPHDALFARTLDRGTCVQISHIKRKGTFCDNLVCSGLNVGTHDWEN